MPARKSAAPTPDRRFWLVKSEPDVFSFDDLWNSPDRTTCWDGVRNYLARNYMRDQMQVGDGILFYHSSTEPTAVVGTARVVRAAYPDHTALDARDPHFDPKSRAEAPTWMMVDIRAERRLARALTLDDLRAEPALAGMELLRKGSRLSVQPVTAEEWRVVTRLGGIAE